MRLCRHQIIANVLLFGLPIPAGHASSTDDLIPKPAAQFAQPTSGVQSLPEFIFQDGWSIELKVSSFDLQAADNHPVFSLSDSGNDVWLKAEPTMENGKRFIKFSLVLDYNSQPLSVGFPVSPTNPSTTHALLLRFSGYRLDLYCDGVLVDQEWPIGNVHHGKSIRMTVSKPVVGVSMWADAITDQAIERLNGGPGKIAKRESAFFGPEPSLIQYSRPRGFNTNAGDAMPFYHDGTFHLYYLLDRRQHHSKWRLGAHQWAHISSTDLVHWTTYPIALRIQHQWEGSICTGSVYFHDGDYRAFYATRMPDRSERLGLAHSSDGIHFNKDIPTPFSEPEPPFVHAPNRDPSIFEYGGAYHMLVTAAIPDPQNSGKTEGALEHLVSKDLATWTVDPNPFLRVGSADQPECSNPFQWGDRYYLIFSLRGTTHYRVATSPMGPWVTPHVDVLDGPEAIVMKSASFKNDRRILVGFLQHDDMYGGDLIFRELIKEKDGSLGTFIPNEMKIPASSTRNVPDVKLTGKEPTLLVKSSPNTRLSAKAHSHNHSPYSLVLSDNQGGAERLLFDPQNKTVRWLASDGKELRGHLEGVYDLDDASIDLIVFGTVADLTINNHRSLVHRLPAYQELRISASSQAGQVDLSQIAVSQLDRR